MPAPGVDIAADQKPRSTSPAPPARRLSVEASLRTRLTWLLVFRAAVITVLLVTSISVKVWSTESAFAPAALALYGVAGVSYGSVLVGALWLRLFGLRHIRTLAYAQLAFDAGVAAVIVLLTGGVDSIFVFVFSLSILNAAAVLQKQGANTLAAVVTAFYAFVLTAELSGVLPLEAEHRSTLAEALPAFITNTASLVLVAILAGFLAEQLKRTSESLDVARAQIERLEALSRVILESLPSGVLTLNRDGTVLYVNNAGAELLGAGPDRLIGAPLTNAPGAFPIPEPGPRAVRFEEPVEVQDQRRTVGGTVSELTGFAQLAGCVVVFQDLTELRRLQQEVAQGERLAELGRFAAGLAHEIRNPLAAMIGCLQLLQSETGAHTGGDAARLLGIVQREAERLSVLVSEFLRYARPSTPTLLPTRVLSLAREAVDAATPGFPPFVEFDVEGEDALALCDAEQVRQALWNLLSNAVQVLAHHRGPTPAGRVHVSVRRREHMVLLAVDDDGPGVPEELRTRIFEPFFTTRAEGTGLGLAAVHQMMQQMHGKVSVETSALGGARFILQLPVVEAGSIGSSAA